MKAGLVKFVDVFCQECGAYCYTRRPKPTESLRSTHDDYCDKCAFDLNIEDGYETIYFDEKD